MTKSWQRRAVGIAGLSALLGVALLMLMGVGGRLDRSMPDITVSSATDHAAFVSLPDSRPTLAYVETLALLGFGLLFTVALIDHHGVRSLLARSDGVVRQRRWRARMVGAPPVPSSSSSPHGPTAGVSSARSAHVRSSQHPHRPFP